MGPGPALQLRYISFWCIIGSPCYITGSPLSFPVVPVYDLPLEWWNKNVVHQASMPPRIDLWLQISSLKTTSTQEVPLTARGVCTPLSTSAWHMTLRDHPNTHLVRTESAKDFGSDSLNYHNH